MTSIIILLIALNICHFLADYTHLSTAWMLNAKRTGSPFYSILCHALVHGVTMAVVLFLFGITPMTVLLLFLFQTITHAWIDTLKGRLNVWLPAVANPANKIHWILFGADQLAHQLVIISMVYFALK